MITVFVLGYLAIALEHQIHVDKAASALIAGVLCWAIYILSAGSFFTPETVPDHMFVGADGSEIGFIQAAMYYIAEYQLLHHLSEIASILFFLIGAMAIVELIDIHQGFSLITDKIETTSRPRLMWIICILTFFLSAALDNLTTTIVMASLLKKIIANYKDRWLFAGMIVVAANAGGAWSPIGDVTTTMLWIGKQVTAQNVIIRLILPSLICLLVPLALLTPRIKGNVRRPEVSTNLAQSLPGLTYKQKRNVFLAGILGLVFVPIFKTVTHLPPFMGMMLSLGILWVMTEIMHKRKNVNVRKRLSVIAALKKVDFASVLFFMGILLAVGSLQSAGQLGELAGWLNNTLGTDQEGGVYAVGIFIGLLSALVDNVPLVAASMGMYEILPSGYFSQDGLFWEFLAYCAGTGGSALIIGSAAGVAVMGIETITFGWYLKKIAPLALVGYFAGAIFYILEHSVF
ncbi:MAG: sodium:proton antiporter NhaD [Cryomorphaceae bacterium]|nr:sodium:proton antiporter NhaD [Cryomorphaceae bacterium]